MTAPASNHQKAPGLDAGKVRPGPVEGAVLDHPEKLGCNPTAPPFLSGPAEPMRCMGGCRRGGRPPRAALVHTASRSQQRSPQRSPTRESRPRLASNHLRG